MFTIYGRKQSFCDRLDRREFLRVGAVGGLSLAYLLRSEAACGAVAKRPKSVIYIVLSGGPSHLDTWDPKPDAPLEFRGDFRSISSQIAGVRLCELFPRQAQMLDRLALLRGVQSVENDHFLSEVYTGLPRKSGKRPAFGSVVSRSIGKTATLPPYVCLNEATTDQFEYEKPHYAGAAHAPFRPFGDAIENMAAVQSLARLDDRRKLLGSLAALQRKVDSDAANGLDHFHAQALAMISSSEVRQAFDLTKEPVKTFERYGHGKYTHQADKNILYDWSPKPLILARRLVEAGVRVVTLQVGSWDHHSGASQHIFESYRHVLPVLDQNISALVDDLEQRGLSDDVLVVVLGEFGRTPKVTYPGPGREHWAEAGCVLMAGGGLKMGQVIGETDSRGERAKSGKISFQNIMATIYHVLGIDPKTTIPDFNGRPQYLLDDTDPIRELVS